ncbi:chitobiase/beta-hexosaminidase C-terminal domain-containing protein [Flavobacterium sp. P21]|uniref:chitobiase/beta-hexosaminidase C-terminal domain-containing protein n=1 Tax=Flavobacterium sp. P21 TaxID=3423948 RepID=UPI003D672080
MKRLADMGIAFRDFPPTAIYKNGTITVAPPYEGAIVRFDKDGNEPTRQSPLYTGPIKTKDYEQYRFRVFFNETSASPAVKVEKLPVATWNTAKAEVLTISENISEHVDKKGIWYLNFNPTDDGANGIIKNASLFENDKLLQTYSDEKTLKSKPRLRFLIENYNEKNTYRLDFSVENREEKNLRQM